MMTKAAVEEEVVSSLNLTIAKKALQQNRRIRELISCHNSPP
jgi:hypothetical protein